MKIINQSFEIQFFPEECALKLVEKAGRVCWKSEDKITDDSAGPFVSRILKSGHESVIEHASATVLFVVDRGVSHELVRQRLCSFSQSSTRYANYSKGKFGSEITVIKPYLFKEGTIQYKEWYEACISSEKAYMNLIANGITPEWARSVLPNSTMTEIFTTANMRQWRHIFKLRCANGAHPQIREIMRPCLSEFAKRMPVLFSDLDKQFNGVDCGQ
ncbi:MAG: FAD-dependent thymidylate synthase [Epsilonproteobacteria bacterium]|nr:FAD-dependent thymidylate synthase [Campylobacterota bacterium]